MKAVRTEIIRTILILNEKKDVRKILSLIAKEDKKVRSGIVQLISTLCDSSDLPMFWEILRTEQPVTKRIAVLQIIGQIGNNNDIDKIWGLLKKEDSISVKLQALKVLGQIGDYNQIPQLWQLYESDDISYLKYRILKVIKRRGTAADLPKLWEQIPKEKDINIQISLIRTISKLGTNEDLEKLEQFVNSSQNDLMTHQYILCLPEGNISILWSLLKKGTTDNNKVAIYNGIAKKGASTDVPILWDYFEKEKTKLVKRTIIQTISKLGTPDDIPRLWDFFYKQNEETVRRAIVKAVGKLGNQEDILILKKLLVRSPIRNTVQDSIDNINKRTANKINIRTDLIQYLQTEKGKPMTGNTFYNVSGDLVQGDKIAGDKVSGDKIVLSINYYPLANEKVLSHAAKVKVGIEHLQQDVKKKEANEWLQNIMSAFTQEATKETVKEGIKYSGQLIKLLQQTPEAQAALHQIQHVLHGFLG